MDKIKLYGLYGYLSKAFDCILHELLLPKLHAYGFDKLSLTFIHGHLSQRQQKTKVGSTFTQKYHICWSPRIYRRATFIYNLYLRFVYSQRSPGV